MTIPTLTASRRDKKIAFEAMVADVDGYGQKTGNLTPAERCKAWACIIFGPGAEQRQAAQNGGAQTASFHALSTSATRSVSVRDRIRYPISDANRDNWPVWEIQAIAELGRNEGLAFTATRVAQ